MYPLPRSIIRNSVRDINYGVTAWVFIIFILTLPHIYLRLQKKNATCGTKVCLKTAQMIEETIDRKVSPCDNFYMYACGKSVRKLTGHESDTWDILYDTTRISLKRLLIETRPDESSLPKSFCAQRKFFRACLDTEIIDIQLDLTFFDDFIRILSATWPTESSVQHWTNVVVDGARHGLPTGIFLETEIKLNSTDNSVYLEARPPDTTLRHVWDQKNAHHIADLVKPMLVLTPNITFSANETIEFATQLMSYAENATLRNQEALPLAKLTLLTKNPFPLDLVGTAVTVDYIEKLELLTRKYSKAWPIYVGISYIIRECQFLRKNYRDICSKLIENKESRVEFCTSQALKYYESVAEAQYIRETFTKQNREYIHEYFDLIKAQMIALIKNSSRFPSKVKRGAINAIKDVTLEIGSNDVVYNETEFENIFGFTEVERRFRHDVVQFIHQANIDKLNRTIYAKNNSFEYYLNLDRLKPNISYAAEYDGETNKIVLHGGVLSLPFFDTQQPGYLNFGFLGRIIGHQLSHVLNNTKRANLWTIVSRRLFELDRSCLGDEYERYLLLNGYNLGGDSPPIEEIYADVAGTNLAYLAYQTWSKKHGPDPDLIGVYMNPHQLFWYSTAGFYFKFPAREHRFSPFFANGSIPATRHPWEEFRVVGPLMHNPSFARDFGCSSGSLMNPKRKCETFAK